MKLNPSNTQEDKNLIENIRRYVNELGEEATGTILGETDRLIRVFDDGVIRMIISGNDYNLSYAKRMQLEVSNRLTGETVIVAGVTEIPAGKDWWGAPKFDYEEFINLLPGFKNTAPILDKMFDVYNIGIGDMVKLSHDTYDQIYVVKKFGVKRKDNTYCLPVGTDWTKNATRRGICYNSRILRKCSQKELQEHYDRWKEIAKNHSLT